MPSVNEFNLKSIVAQALHEDQSRDDVTTKALSFGSFMTQAQFVAKENGVIAGLQVCAEVFREVDAKLQFRALKKDGDRVKEKDIIAAVKGKASSIFAAERSALNFLAKLSGIATLTRAFVDKANNPKLKILDTRKTTPGLRILEKYAVRMGGGYNHRQDLNDAVLVKDTHIAAFRQKNKDATLVALIEQVRKKAKHTLIEIEVSSTKEFKEVLSARPDIIMLDNMSAFEMRECVRMKNRFDKTIQLEVSGNVNLLSIVELAKLGVERISIGSLTHSPKALDISLRIL